MERGSKLQYSGVNKYDVHGTGQDNQIISTANVPPAILERAGA